MKPHRIIPYEEAKAQALIAKRIALNNGQPEIVKAIHQLTESADEEIDKAWHRGWHEGYSKGVDDETT